MHCGDCSAASAFADELLTLADEKGTAFFKLGWRIIHGCVSARSGKASEAVKTISGIPAWNLTGMRLFSADGRGTTCKKDRQ
jgi:hypothetical protein